MKTLGIQLFRNRRGSALLFTMLIVGLLMFMGIFLMERILPASKDTRGIESWNAAYYLAEWAEETGLAYMSGSNPFVTSTGATGSWLSGTGSDYDVSALTNTIPKSWKGNSEYDKDWNTLSPGSPIQLRFKDTINLATAGSLTIAIRIPIKWSDAGYNTFANSGSGIINWTVSDGSGAVLIGSGTSMFYATDITGTALNINTKHGSDFSSNLTSAQLWQDVTIASFAGSHLGSVCSTQKCSIRFSIVNSLRVKNVSGDIVVLPYLEYKITSAVALPEQYATIVTHGYYRGFEKTKTRKVRQTTGNEALDFAVFQ